MLMSIVSRKDNFIGFIVLKYLPIAPQIQRLINYTERRGCSTLSPIPREGSRIALPRISNSRDPTPRYTVNKVHKGFEDLRTGYNTPNVDVSVLRIFLALNLRDSHVEDNVCKRPFLYV